MNTKILFLTHMMCKFLPNTGFWKLKNFMYRWAGAKIGENVRINSSAKLCGTGEIILEGNNWIGPEALLLTNNNSKITMKMHARMGLRVVVVTGFHGIDPTKDCIIDGEDLSSEIELGSGSDISTGSIVLPGVKIGKMAHVAAGSVVTKDIPEYFRAMGVPARPTRDLRIPKQKSSPVSQ